MNKIQPYSIWAMCILDPDLLEANITTELRLRHAWPTCILDINTKACDTMHFHWNKIYNTACVISVYFIAQITHEICIENNYMCNVYIERSQAFGDNWQYKSFFTALRFVYLFKTCIRITKYLSEVTQLPKDWNITNYIERNV